MLSERLTALSSGSDAMAFEVRKSIDDAEALGHLPFDLAAILRGMMPAHVEISIDDLDLTLDDADDGESFDEPTVPLLKKPAAAPDVPRTVPAAELPPMPMPTLPFAAVRPSDASLAALPDHASIREKVDDAVLSSLVGEYRSMRQGRDTGAGRGQKPDALDGLLTGYKAARYRSDARRARSGAQVNGLDLAGLDDFSAKRAGIGSILRDRFILDREVGRGGMGVVYAAVDRRRLEAASGDPYVALKLINDEIRGNGEALRMLEAEARKAQSLAHPNIGTVYDFDRDGAEIFIVMELLTGRPLSRLLASSVGQPLPGAEIAGVLRGLCAGLSHAHQRGVVHSDLKPGNIFVSPENEVKIIDFGLATAVQTSLPKEVAGLTVTYASPEMFEDAPRDPRDDIFALGCIAYQLLTGVHPFRLKPINEAVEQGIRPEPIGDIDRDAWRAIDRALAFEREARLEAVDAFATAVFDS